MDRVNLLPEEARTGFFDTLLQKIDRDFLRVLGFCLGAAAAAAVFLWFGQMLTARRQERRLDSLKSQIESLRTENEGLEAQNQQLDQVEKELLRQKKLLTDRLEHLQAIQSQPRIWADVLRDLRQSIPRGVWLTELETGQGSSLRIAGGATDEDLVTGFMESLKESPRFSDVSFTFTEKDRIGDVPIVKFEIVCKAGQG